MVSEGTRTSNSCIKSWFNDQQISPSILLQRTEKNKIHKSRRIAYQIPEDEDSACGRSFEAAFMLSNRTLFNFGGAGRLASENKAWEDAKKIQKKSDYALGYAIKNTNWNVPKYILEGLEWLMSEMGG